jgi:dihydroorotate dehydrogenase electron transfer subunit
VHRRDVCADHFELTLRLPRFADAVPGQFVQVLCRAPGNGARVTPTSQSGAVDDGPMLRRPFSIGGLRRRDGGTEIDLLGRVVGPGTEWLGRRKVGDGVNVLGPLGSGFSMPPVGAVALLVAGGVGLPPIRWMGEYLKKNGYFCVAWVGARHRGLLPVTLRSEPDRSGKATLCAEEFSRDEIPVCITTDDGSCGTSGRVTDALADFFSSAPAGRRCVVYACGPEAMLRATAELCRGYDVPCELAMERVMACGMGTCQSCVVRVRDDASESGWRYALCCREGPVFDGRRVFGP